MELTQERIEHIRKLFTGDLLIIRETLLMMAGIADRNLNAAIGALLDRDDKRAEMVEQEDSQLDQLERDVDEMIVAFMATRSPVATACRLMIASTKIANELEIIGDQAVGLARIVKELNVKPQIRVMGDFPQMGRMSVEMMRMAINSFTEINPDLAIQVIHQDKIIDAKCREIVKELTEFMIDQSSIVTVAYDLALAARRIERAADGAKHIAQGVYYLYTAQDIRHRA